MSQQKSRRRLARGSGIAEAVVGMLLVTGASVMGILFLLNSGSAIFYKEKLVILANLAAQYAAQNFTDSNLQVDTEKYVENIMPHLGLKSSDLNVAVTSPVTIKTNNVPLIGVQVQISNKFLLFGDGSAIPATVQLSDLEFAPNASTMPAPSGWRLMESQQGETPGLEPIVTGNVQSDTAAYQNANPGVSITATPVYSLDSLSPSQLSLGDK